MFKIGEAVLIEEREFNGGEVTTRTTKALVVAPNAADVRTITVAFVNAKGTVDTRAVYPKYPDCVVERLYTVREAENALNV